jgi:hypothetical protein
MKTLTYLKGLLSVFLTAFISAPGLLGQTGPNLWATTMDGTQISSYTISNGLYKDGPTTIFTASYPNATNNYSRTAALGRYATNPSNGYFYWLGTSSGNNNNNGLVEVFGSTANGSSTTKIGQLDLNGGNNNNLGFVRLGMGADGTGWILAGDGSTLFLAKFASNGVTPVNIVLEDNNVTLSGGSAATFTNGDLCLSGNNSIYALANNGSGVTQIFIGAPNGNSTVLTKKWDLVNPNGSSFQGQVNGVAFDALGSLYLSSANGLYFINQYTVNGPAGTVQCALVQANLGLQDLASSEWPQQSTLPTTLTSFTGSYKNGITTLNWAVENEVNFSHYEIERKTASANDYQDISNKIAAGNTAGSGYQFSDNISGFADQVFYYRIKMVDLDGKFKYSNIIMVRKDQKMITGMTMNPNPVRTGESATIRFQSAVKAVVAVRIVDLAGRTVSEQQNNANEGINSIQVNNLDHLQPGIYVIQMSTGEFVSARKFTIVR